MIILHQLIFHNQVQVRDYHNNAKFYILYRTIITIKLISFLDHNGSCKSTSSINQWVNTAVWVKYWLRLVMYNSAVTWDVSSTWLVKNWCRMTHWYIVGESYLIIQLQILLPWPHIFCILWHIFMPVRWYEGFSKHGDYLSLDCRHWSYCNQYTLYIITISSASIATL